MKVRNPTRALTRTYVKTKKYKDGSKKYEATIVLPSTRAQFSCTRRQLTTAVQCLRNKAGIRTRRPRRA